MDIFEKIEKEAAIQLSLMVDDKIKKMQKQTLKEAPIDTADLRKSLIINTGHKKIKYNEVPSFKINNLEDISIDISYNTKYALLQHEFFKKKTPGTKTKYLRDPFFEIFGGDI